MFLLILVIIIAFVLWYALRGRAWLKEQSWTQGFLAWIEPFETALYQKSETMLVGRLLWVSGALVTAYDSVAAFLPSLDMTPITNRLFSFVPDDLRGIVVSALLMGLGFLIGWLRKRTSLPLAVVAAPEAPKD